MKDESLPIPPSDRAQSRDEIAAEIVDHLAAAEAELTKRGVAAEEARFAARKKFGDVEKIQKTCYWIQNGETIMLRWTLVALASVLCVLLGLSVLGNWRTQSQLAEQVGKLSDELKAMAAAKQTPPPVPQPPEITGVIYEGSKEKPLAGRRVAILRADGTVVRRTSCDENGVFRSGPLEPGDYCVTTPLTGGPRILADWVAQSKPIFLHSASGSFPLDLDAAYHAGGVKLIANRPLPDVRKDGSYLIKSRLSAVVDTPRRWRHLWTPKQDAPEVWPLYCQPTETVNPIQGDVKTTRASLVLDQEKSTKIMEASETGRFPIGKAEITIALVLTVLPIDESGNVVLSNRYFQMLPRVREGVPNYHAKPFNSVAWSKLDDDAAWSSISDSKPWFDHLAGGKSYSRSGPESPLHQEIEIREGEFTTLQVEIPESVEAEIQKAVDETTDVQKLADLVNKGLLQRPLKITATRYEPMEK